MKNKTIATAYFIGLIIAGPIFMYLAKLSVKVSAGCAGHIHLVDYVLIWSVASMTSIIFTMLMLNGED